MVPAGILSASYFAVLTSIDMMIAFGVQRSGCPDCGGRLHAAHYQRKPRGHPEDLDQTMTRRLSWCCGRDGCRRRVTPPSVRFWGQLVYTASIVLALVSTPVHSSDETSLLDSAGCSRQSLRRWRERFCAVWETPTGRTLTGSMVLDGHQRQEPQQTLSLWRGRWPFVGAMWQLLIHPLTGGKRWKALGLNFGTLDPQKLDFAHQLAVLQTGIPPP